MFENLKLKFCKILLSTIVALKEFFTEAIFTACLIFILTILIKLQRSSAVLSLKNTVQVDLPCSSSNIWTVYFSAYCIQTNILAMKSNNFSHKLFVVNAVIFSFFPRTTFPSTLLEVSNSTEDKQRY